jgi:hypothetical protein
MMKKRTRYLSAKITTRPFFCTMKITTKEQKLGL